jgi:hypothetical protein
MVLVALLIGAVLIVAAIRNSQGDLFTAIAKDVPEFVVWGAAIIAVGAIGFISGLKPVSRGLLALIVVVLVLRNYKAILNGFQSAWKEPPPVVDTTAASQSTGMGAIGGAGQLGQIGTMIQNNFGSIDGTGGFGSQAGVGG